MEVILAKTAGFCFGVKRAVDTVYKEAGKKNVYTYGPIIHNSEVVNDLKKKGVKVINSREELEALEEGTVIIRSHGVAREIYDLIHEKGLELVDATCPFVRKIHKIVEKAGNDGDQVIIVGSEQHPEVQGIKGWCTGEVHIISDAEQFEGIDLNKPTTLVSQTTFNYKKFQDLVEILNKKGYDIGVCNTICNATEERQLEAKSIAKGVDAMVVIGDKQSSNSQKLYEISKKECENTFFVQTLRDLDLKLFESTGKVGITAGASTPQKIIKEVHASMTEKSFEELLEESFVTIHNGEVVKGTVIDVKPDEIILNIGYKADGILTRSEYSNDSANVDLTTVAKVGDTMETKVLKVNDGEGQVLLTYKRLAAEKGNKRLEEAFENKEVLKAPVAQVLDGGLSVLIEEARVFIPASLVSDSYERDLKKYEGQEIEFVISEFNPRKRRVIGDRKQLLVAAKKEKQKELFEKIEAGMKVEGVVKNVTDFGAFIDLGGADGLLHISEMSWGRVENPKKVFNIGDKVTVLIKDIQGEKIALSLKFPEENPWLKAEEKYKVGSVVTGKVARMTDFGAFVELESGIDALLHVSQIAKEHIDKPSDVLSVGQEIEFVISEFNPRKRRVIGDRKQLLVAAKKEKQKELFEKIEAGMKVEGVVKNVTDFGAFIDLGGADGLLHISEMSWGRVENPKKVFNIGDKVTVLIKDIQGEKIALSLKFPEENPWLKAEEKYKVGSVVTGKVARMTDFGAFVELESGIDALLHVSQIAKEHIDKPSDVLSVGQEIEAKVVDFKKDDKKISLSMKALANEEEKTEE